MILIHAYMTIVPASRAEFLRQVDELAQASRAEAGCTGFTCYEDVTAPDSFVILGEWSDQAAFDLHEQSSHVAQFKAGAAGLIRARQPTRVYAVDGMTGL